MGSGPQLLRLHSFISVAIREPRLRRLMPFTSHGVLGFSRIVGYPYSGDCPWVEPLGRCWLRCAGPGRVAGSTGHDALPCRHVVRPVRCPAYGATSPG
ncbi:DUF6193 family natural product biosynthesis protein [Micromonospora taraxaci]|uniref:DUF6193 family natural product biosynthesis protein n=1 Tax=Micromonospora taraxaci TaxID=1316803 RepID=UPI003C2F51AC